jgi:N-acetylglucosaminyldiphosphoundecaprenol N-acetyl-beta-D-mannosaminyltransferase
VHADPAKALSTTIPAKIAAGCNHGIELNALMTDVCEICGVPVSRGDLGSHVREVAARAEQGRGAWILTLNTEMLARGVQDPAYWSLVRKADIITADGMPLVWASRIKCAKAAVPGRTTGVDLVDAMLRLDSVPRFAVIGGQDPRTTIEQYGPSATGALAFVFDGRVDLSESQMAFFCDQLTRHQARVVFIALGVPKQDRLALELRNRLPQLVLLGIGGTFEILGPKGSRAPLWMQRTGLEWLFRLINEPGRLWRRYLVNYPRGVWRLVKDCLAVSR